MGWASCHDGDNSSLQGNEYAVHASFDVDSTVVLDHLMLYTDSHVALSEDSLFLSTEGTFDIEHRTPGLDELYLCSDYGELCRFYATGGMSVSVAVSGRADSLVATFAPAATDSINPWLQGQVKEFDASDVRLRRTMMDSLCHSMSGDVRCALLLREEVESLADSVFVRQCLGALKAEAKPEWLVKSIDDLLISTSTLASRNRRLPGNKFVINDTLTYNMAVSRSDYLLVYVWADYDQTSVDSLTMLMELLDDEYYMKRLQIFTCCVGAADSAAWQAVVNDFDGLHVWLPAGLADRRIRNWQVQRVPMLMLLDMYNNQQRRDVWGKELRDALSRLPNRSGFAHTPKTKPKKYGR